MSSRLLLLLDQYSGWNLVTIAAMTLAIGLSLSWATLERSQLPFVCFHRREITGGFFAVVLLIYLAVFAVCTIVL